MTLQQWYFDAHWSVNQGRKTGWVTNDHDS